MYAIMTHQLEYSRWPPKQPNYAPNRTDISQWNTIRSHNYALVPCRLHNKVNHVFFQGYSVLLQNVHIIPVKYSAIITQIKSDRGYGLMKQIFNAPFDKYVGHRANPYCTLINGHKSRKNTNLPIKCQQCRKQALMQRRTHLYILGKVFQLYFQQASLPQ